MTQAVHASCDGAALVVVRPDPMRRVHFSRSSSSASPLPLLLLLLLLPLAARAFVPSFRIHAQHQQQQRPRTCNLGTSGRSAGLCVRCCRRLTRANPHIYICPHSATEADAEQQPSRGSESTDRQGFLKGLGITASAALLGTYIYSSPTHTTPPCHPCTYIQYNLHVHTPTK